MMITEYLDVNVALHLFSDRRLSDAGKSRSTGRLRGTADERNDDAPDEGIGHPHRLGCLLHGCDEHLADQRDQCGDPAIEVCGGCKLKTILSILHLS